MGRVPSSLVGLNVLVVEDEQELRELFPHWLRAAGANCTLVDTLEAARRALKRVKLDALVIDKRLPDGDGHQALLDNSSIELPRAIVAISGYFTPEAELLAQAAGALVLHKPFTSPDLLHALELASQRKQRAPARDSGTFTLVSAGEWRIAPDGATLQGKEYSLRVTPRERDVLAALLQSRETWIPTRALALEVLGRDDDAGLVTIRSHVRYLRDRLGAHAALLQSSPRYGYRWAG